MLSKKICSHIQVLPKIRVYLCTYVVYMSIVEKVTPLGPKTHNIVARNHEAET